MNRERAEAHLRLLAEAELREATTVSSGGGASWRPSGRLALIARRCWTSPRGDPSPVPS